MASSSDKAGYESSEIDRLRAELVAARDDYQRRLWERDDEIERLMAEIVLYRRLVSEHHSVGVSAPEGALIGDQCPICAAFYERAEENIWKVIIEG